jgi:hypothetical protein
MPRERIRSREHTKAIEEVWRRKLIFYLIGKILWSFDRKIKRLDKVFRMGYDQLIVEKRTRIVVEGDKVSMMPGIRAGANVMEKIATIV